MNFIKSKSTLFLVILIITTVIGIIVFEETTLFSKQNTSKQPTPTTQTLGISEDEANLRQVLDESDYYRGNRDASVIFIEYSDLECPYCKRFHSTMKQVIDTYGNEVLWVYRHFPLDSHPNAQKAAEAAECVGKYYGNDAFWNFTDLYFSRTTSNGTGFPTANLASLASEIGAETETIQSCIDSGQMAEKVASNFQSGVNSGVTGTPGTLLVPPNGQVEVISGAVSYDQMKQIIESLL